MPLKYQDSLPVRLGMFQGSDGPVQLSAPPPINRLTWAFIWSWAIIPLRSSEALRLLSGPGHFSGSLSAAARVTRCLFLLSAHRYPFHSLIVKQFRELSVFLGSFAQIHRGVADTQTHQGVETERPPADPPRKKSAVGGVIFKVLLQNGADTRRSAPQGVLTMVSSLLSCRCVSSLSCTIFREISSRSNTPTSSQSVSSHTKADTDFGPGEHLHMQTHTLIQLMSVAVRASG